MIARIVPTLVMLVGLFAFRSSLADQYVIPSGSMEPTIQIGDHVLVDKRAYDLKIPFTDRSLFVTGSPRRGDVVVFCDPRNPSINLIKRLIGLPGDRIRVMDGLVSVNGVSLAVSSPPAGIQTRLHRSEAGVFSYLESGSGVRSHSVQRIPRMAVEADQEFAVPADHYFFLGDNRDNSADSRFWGFAPRDALRGKAVGVLYSVRWPGPVPSVSFGRTGTAL